MRNTDPCLSCCKHPLGICTTGRTCWHHLEARIETTRGSDAETHPDPTANTAIRNMMREQRKKGPRHGRK